MAVEASGGGGADTETRGGGELVARSEQEAKKEREMGGELEHIARRDGDENDSGGTDGSFVMVTGGGDTDGRSDSSEKDTDLYVGGCGVGDPSEWKGAVKPAENSASFTGVDDVKLEKEGKEATASSVTIGSWADEVDAAAEIAGYGEESEKIRTEEEQAQDFDPPQVDPKEGPLEFQKLDPQHKEDEKIEVDNSNIEEEKEMEAVSVKLSDQEQNQVEDGKEAAETNVDGSVAILENGLENHLEDKDVVFENSKSEKIAAIRGLINEEEAVSVELPINHKGEKAVFEGNEEPNQEHAEEEKDANIEHVNNEVFAVEKQNHLEDGLMVAEGLKDGNGEAIEHKIESRKPVEEEVADVEGLSKKDVVFTDPLHKKQAATFVVLKNDEMNQLEGCDYKKDVIIDDPVDGKHESEQVLVGNPVNGGVELGVEIEERNKADGEKGGEVDSSVIEETKVGNCEVVEEICSSVPAEKAVDHELEIDEGNNMNDEEEQVESAPIHQVDDSFDSIIEVGDRSISNGELSICNGRKDDQHGEVQSSTKQTMHHNIDASDPKLDVQEKEHGETSSTVLKPEPSDKSGSAPEEEKNMIQEAVFISPNPKHEKFMDAAQVKQKGDVVVLQIGSHPEPIKLHLESTSKSEEIQDIEVSSVCSSAPVDEDLSLSSVSDSAGPVSEKREIKAATIDLDKHQAKIGEEEKVLISDEKQDDSKPSIPDTGVKGEVNVKKFYMVKVPRLTRRVIHEEQQEKMRDAQHDLEEKTRIRDSLKAELENMRKALSSCCHKRDSAIEEEKKAKALLNTKRIEMDSLQAAISKGKAATSYLDIISQIHSLQHKIQHETISLKDEKKFLHDLNQLKHERELHFFNKCSQSEIDDAVKQKEAAESNLRGLKKEFDSIRSAHMKADECLKSAGKMYVDQFNKIKEHEQKWKAANEFRQNSYKTFHGLKSDKMEHYSRFMEDYQVAKKYISSGDNEALEKHCMEQVERIMQLWNDDEGFRKLYIDSNINSYLRRFATLDGRNLAPNEPRAVAPIRLPASNARTPAAVEEQPPQMKRTLASKQSKGVARTIVVSREEEVERVDVAEEKKPTKEEEEERRLAEEKAREEEGMRKEREAAELKEKLRTEQIAKAKEADGRKRRKAEKAQARALYRAQKEAELKEQKKVKKEKKKEQMSSDTTASVEGDATETCGDEATQEHRVSKSCNKQAAAAAAALNKFSNRVQPVPLHIRNKGKKKIYNTWFWTLFGAAAVGGLFIAGNYVNFSNISMIDFGF